MEELQVILQIPPHRVVLQILSCDLLLERVEHGLLLHQLILMISSLQLIYLLRLHKLKLLLLNDNVSEAVFHLESVESHLVLPLVIVLDRGACTVVPFEPQIHAVLKVLTALGKGLVRFLPSGIDDGGILNDRLEAAGVLTLALAVVRLKSLLQLLGHAGGARCRLSLVMLSIRNASSYLPVKGRQVPDNVFLLQLPLLPLFLGAALLIFELMLQILVVAE